VTRSPSIGALAGVAFLALGCGQQPVNVVPASFSRPDDIVFTCLDMDGDLDLMPPLTGPGLVPLENCNGLTGDKSEDRVLIALLTQTATGEVAAVDLRAKEPLDSRDVVPGYTFLRVGEVPSGITLRPDAPHVTYVANFGSHGVMAIPTVLFFPPEMGIADQAAATVGFENVNLPGAPTDLALSEDGSFLFAPIPSLGVVAQLPLDADGGFATDMAGDPIVLQIPLTAAMDVPVAPPNDPTVVYGRVCPPDYPLRPPMTSERTPVALGTGPEPLRVLVDGDTLLVADSAEPVIHRFQMGAYGVYTDASATALEDYTQLATAVPVLELAVTPEVPESIGATAPSRFLYAIDALDQSILAMDYLVGSPTYGAVLATHVGNEPSDRVQTVGTGKARALTVVQPGFLDDMGMMESECSASSTFAATAGPTYLRGVFLVAAMTDGTLRFFDVYDLDAPCRGSTCPGTDITSSDEEVYIERHEPRVGTYVQQSIAITTTPSLSYGSSPGRIDIDGSPSSGSGPGLNVLSFDPSGCTAFPSSAYFDPACRAYMKPLYGADGSPLICAQSDPWGMVAQTWSATWNGSLPQTHGGRGRFVYPGTVASVGLSDPFMGFCDAGVLGSMDVTASGLGMDDPELGYGGDQLVVLSDVPARLQGNADCAPFVIPDSPTDERDLIAFAIVTASQGALELEPLGSFSLAAFQTCFPDPVAYEVRTHDAYAVLGSFDGFLHRVIDGGSQCLVDTSQAVDPCDPTTYKNGRTFGGATFVSPQIIFEIEDRNIPAGTDAQLLVSVGLAPPQLSLDSGTQPVSLRYSSTDGYLYSVDTDSLGLVRIDLQPVSRIDTIQ